MHLSRLVIDESFKTALRDMQRIQVKFHEIEREFVPANKRRYLDVDSTFLERHGRQTDVDATLFSYLGPTYRRQSSRRRW